MNEDQVDGRAKRVEGKIEEVAGEIAGKKDMERRGKLKNAVGKVQASFGDLKSKIKKHK